MTPRAPAEQFAPLSAAGVTHAFTLRVPGLDVAVEREAALQRLEALHTATRQHLGLGGRRFVTAEQVHGARVAVVASTTAVPVAVSDGLITADPAVCLGIYVADCGPVFIVDRRRRVSGLLHSGRKGTELGITTVALRLMQEEFGSAPEDLLVLLGPCIRPPHYEIDFAQEILRQARAAGVREVHDSGRCTASEPERYYSYRRELGKTGRMLALLAL